LSIPSSHFINLLGEIAGDNKGYLDMSKPKEVLGRIKTKIDYKFLYLPTYRRVEQDFRELGISSDEDDILYDYSIKFGMRDVDKKIKEITNEIKTSSVEWFSKVNGEMLSQLVEGFPVDESFKDSIKKPDAIKIVLDRIGNNIDESYKQRIIKLIEEKFLLTMIL